ncbi:MAG: germination protein YpeB [Clostridiales bacterium]|nr:germination protein YpeB [Clostridiales bacterium]
MKNFLTKIKPQYVYAVLAILVILSIVLGYLLYKENKEHAVSVENQYNLAFSEVINYVQNVENYLAKSLISSTSEHAAETLTNVWREANLAQAYLAQLPISSNELSATSKFLNQVSDYSYSLSRENINGTNLNDEDFNNLQTLYNYSRDLEGTLTQLYTDMYSGRISWKELTKDVNTAFAQQVDNLSATSFSNIESNFGEYEGLIYDGAYSSHIETVEKKGLTGEDIDEKKAKQIAKEFIGKDRIKEINSNGLVENGSIPVYDFNVTLKNEKDDDNLNISISKKGGHIVLMNYNRDISVENLSYEEADKVGIDFLNSRGIPNMASTYYLKQGGAITINYAYEQDGVVVYPDLIKLKIALDDGEILGIETTGYLNNHTTRDTSKVYITEEQAKQVLNSNLQITSSGLAIIPTEYKTEILCYEFKGKINDIDFLAYINAENGKEENILIIINTPNGILTQ